ncbi:MAG: glycosyltransferase family 9 protein [Pseudomonadota bacterium]
MNKRSRRYLFILMGALGDVVRGMYLVNSLKAAEPDAHITWLVEPACSGILKLHPAIDEIIVFNRPKGLAGVWEIRKELSKRSFDITLDLQRHSKSGLFSWFSRSPRRIGFHRKDAKEFNWLFNTEYVDPQGEAISKIEHYHTFLKPLGLPQPERLSSGLEGITLEGVTASWAEQLRREPYVGFILGSSWESKDWPVEGYEGLLSLLPGGTVVFLADKSKIAMAERLQQVATKATVVNLAGKTNLTELVALVRGARVLVGPDSGPGHIAGAVGTPHITLFGPTPWVRNAPRGSEELTLTANVGCAPCKRRVCPGLGKVCMKLLRPEMVFDKMAGFMGWARS